MFGGFFQISSNLVGSGRKLGFGRLRILRFGLGFRWSGIRVSGSSDRGQNDEKSGKTGISGKNQDFGEKWGKTGKMVILGVLAQKVVILLFSRSMSGLVHLLFRIISGNLSLIRGVWAVLGVFGVFRGFSRFFKFFPIFPISGCFFDFGGPSARVGS